MHRILPATLFTILLAATLHGAVLVRSAFSPQAIAAGEDTTYTVTITGTSTDSMEGQPPEVQGITVESDVSTSRQVNIVNGSITSSLSYSWQVSAPNEGRFTIPAYSVRIGNDTCTVPAATLVVGKPGADSAAAVTANALVVAVSAPDKLYPGQVAAGTLKILSRSDLRRAGGFNPKVSADGLIVDALNPQLATQGSESRAGTAYEVLSVPVRITAVKPGSQTLVFEVAARYAVPERRRSAPGTYDDELERMMQMPLIDPMDAKLRTVTARGSALIEILPLPPGKPDSFGGAVGSFAMAARLSGPSGRVGEPLELTVTVTGKGDLRSLESPALDASGEWKGYPPTSEIKADDALETSGKKTFKFLLAPLRPGKLDLPVVRFSYLDPSSGKYVELQADPGFVEVTGDPLVPVGPAAKTPAPEARNSPAAKTDPFHTIELLDTPAAPSALLPPQKNRFFLFSQIVPALLFLVAVAVPLVRRGRELDPAARRRRAFAKKALAAAKKAHAAAARKDDAGFYKAAQEALRQAVCARETGRRPETVSAADVVRALGEEGESLHRDAGLIFSGDEALLYGAPRVPTALLADKLDEILTRLEVA